MAGRRNSKSTKKNTDDASYVDENATADEFDHIVESIEENINKNNKRKHQETTNTLDIRNYEDLEAKETNKKRKKDEAPKHNSTTPKTTTTTKTTQERIPKVPKEQKDWNCAEAALLKNLITGTSPIGRNVSGVHFYSFSHLHNF